MSLTSHLDRPDSPVSQFLREHFPHANDLARACSPQLAGVPPLRPAASGGYPYPTVGTALDYRLRYYFAVTPPDQFVAWRAAVLLSVAPPFIDQCAFFTELSQVVAEINPVGRRLDAQQEAQLARYCYVLALFEAIYRAGPQIKSPLYTPPNRTVADLLAKASDAVVADLCALSWGFHDHCTALLARPAVLNPTFDGSHDIGGADADLIVDGCLIDIKTTVKPRVDPSWLYQLLGYVLLDYTDRYQIRAVALYLARQQRLLRWPLDAFLANLAGSVAPPLADVRARFQAVLQVETAGTRKKDDQEGHAVTTRPSLRFPRAFSPPGSESTREPPARGSDRLYPRQKGGTIPAAIGRSAATLARLPTKRTESQGTVKSLVITLILVLVLIAAVMCTAAALNVVR